jgi:hypothetical protein
MAELVDAADSKSADCKVVQVRFLFWAQTTFGWFFVYIHPSCYSQFKLLLDKKLAA